MSKRYTLEELQSNPDYMILKRLPEFFSEVDANEAPYFSGLIIDLETMGFDFKQHEIIEIGLIEFYFNAQTGILKVNTEYNAFQDPGKPIPDDITKITGITDAMVHGKQIAWDQLFPVIEKANLVICHNAGFDRKFLEYHPPEKISALFKKKPFACTVKDIPWHDLGFESKKLDYLNWKLGYFYNGHRALTDCWATFNLLVSHAETFEMLKKNLKRKEMIICALNAPYEMKDILKKHGYCWSDGAAQLPKSWYKPVPEDELGQEEVFLESEVYQRPGVFSQLPKFSITAFNRYSTR